MTLTTGGFDDGHSCHSILAQIEKMLFPLVSHLATFDAQKPVFLLGLKGCDVLWAFL